MWRCHPARSLAWNLAAIGLAVLPSLAWLLTLHTVVAADVPLGTAWFISAGVGQSTVGMSVAHLPPDMRRALPTRAVHLLAAPGPEPRVHLDHWFGGFGWKRFGGPDVPVGRREPDGFGAAVPMWLSVAAGLALSAWCHRIGRCSRLEGSCERCGYDLRASPVRCPECGAASK